MSIGFACRGRGAAQPGTQRAAQPMIRGVWLLWGLLVVSGLGRLWARAWRGLRRLGRWPCPR
jgi:hypothetical protein